MGWMAWVRFPVEARVYSLRHWLWGPLSLLSKGTRGSLSGIKRQGSEADYSPPSNAEVKNA